MDNIMLTFITPEGMQDVLTHQDKVYFDTRKNAVDYALTLLNDDYKVFVLRMIKNGHYKTLGFYNKSGVIK